MRERSIPYIFVGLIGLIAGTGPTLDATYRIDAAQTYVGFTVRHVGVSIVEGRFRDVSGTIRFDPDDCLTLSTEVRVRTTSLLTDDAMRDRRLLEKDFLDAETHRYITFKSTHTEKQDEGCALVGELTIRKTTRTIRIPFSWTAQAAQPKGYTQIYFEGQATLNRNDFNLHFDDLTDFLVGNKVQLVLKIVALPDA